MEFFRGLYMLIIIMLFCLEGVVSFLLKGYISYEQPILPLIFLAINSIAILVVLPTTLKERNLYFIVIIGYFLRLGLLFWDFFERHIFVLPHSGSDTENFHRGALEIYLDPNAMMEFRDSYEIFLGGFYHVFGPQRMMAQYLNILFGLGIIIVVVKILQLLQIQSKIIKWVVITITFFPQLLIFSAILLRENIISFSMIVSLYYFVSWYKRGRGFDPLLSILFLGIASYFHSGAAALFLVYFFMFAYYRRSDDRIRLGPRGIVLFSVLCILIVLAFLNYGEVLFYKFSRVDSYEDLYSKASTSSGSSAYLGWLNIQSTSQLILFSPLRMLYFLFSPLPIDWRGMMDVVTFLLDSVVYVFLCIYIFRNRSAIRQDKWLLLALIIAVLLFTFVFAYGTGNAGTAVRHRNKIVAVFLIVFALIQNQKEKTTG